MSNADPIPARSNEDAVEPGTQSREGDQPSIAGPSYASAAYVDSVKKGNDGDRKGKGVEGTGERYVRYHLHGFMSNPCVGY